MITSGGKCLQKELENFAKRTNKEQVSRQAFSKARENIKPEAIKDLSERISSGIEKDARLKTYKGYRLLAVDGTILDLPSNEKLMNHFGYSSNSSDKKQVKALGMVVYDVLNDMALCGELYPYTDSEKKRIIEFSDVISQRETTKNPLFILDRGYPSFEAYCKFIDNNQHFLIRISKNSLSEINNANEKDQEIEVHRKNRTLKLRVVNVKLETGETEKLVTNLSSDFDVEEISNLYSKRWRIETSYQYIKYSALLECFTGESITAIYQDFYISLLVLNIASTMYMEQIKVLDKNQDFKKYRYAPSFTNLIYIIKSEYAKYLLCDSLPKNPLRKYRNYKYIMQFAYAIVPNRKCRRNFNSQNHSKSHPKQKL